MQDNERQREFYESRFAAKGAANEKAANWATNRWTAVRRKIQGFERQSGIKDRVLSLHRQWLGDLSDKDVLDLGCFAGNDLSLYLAQKSQSYIGIDLSDSAISKLNDKLLEAPTAQAIAGDFLTFPFSEAQFDVVYAHSVLHHFADFEKLCATLSRVLKPDGIVIALDPTQTEPFNWLARMIYRPFQSDKDWEWPFKRSNYQTIQRYFNIERVQGYRGFSKIGYVLPFMTGWGVRMDERYATKLGFSLYMCWLVTMRLKKV
jgi:SAM-dependent methyltransferase